MSAGSEAADLIKNGCSPNDVAKKLGKTERIAELKRLLLTQVGEGNLLLSEIYFSIPEPRRKQYQSISEDDPEIEVGLHTLRVQSFMKQIDPRTHDMKVTALGPDHGEIECGLYFLSKDSPYTDTYRFLFDLEPSLHRLIKKTLEFAFPKHDDDWWDLGVPEEIRKRCSIAKEGSAKERRHRYCYTNFIDYKTIIDSKWVEFRKVMPPNVADDKKKSQLLSDLQKANEIRNVVMHPIKNLALTKADCDLIQRLAEQLQEKNWRPPVRHKRFGTK